MAAHYRFPKILLPALSPGCTLIDSSSYLFFFIATAATNLVANAIANDDDSERIVSEALFLALCSGIFLGGLVLVAGTPLLATIAGEASASVVPSALKYATVRAFGQPFVIMASVARAAGKCCASSFDDDATNRKEKLMRAILQQSLSYSSGGKGYTGATPVSGNGIPLECRRDIDLGHKNIIGNHWCSYRNFVCRYCNNLISIG